MCGKGQLCVRAAHERGQLFVDDLDDLLRGCEAFQNVRPDRTPGDSRNEILNDLIAYIRFQKGKAHLAHCLFNIRLCKTTLAAKTLKRSFQLFG